MKIVYKSLIFILSIMLFTACGSGGKGDTSDHYLIDYDPTAFSATYDNNGSLMNINLKAEDKNGDKLKYTIVSQPKHGKLSGKAPHVTYAPNKNYVGTDSFSFKVNNGKVDSNIAVVTINILKSIENNKPVAYSKDIATKENVKKDIVLEATDKDGDTLKYIIVSKPKHGKLSGDAPNLIYTPNKDYVGEDSFGFKVNDGKEDSSIAIVKIKVIDKGVKLKPIANNDSIKIKKEHHATINVLQNDIDKDGVLDINSLRIVKNPLHGNANIANGKIEYSPNKEYTGLDSLSYTIKDNDGLISNEANVTIHITKDLINHNPISFSKRVVVKESREKNIKLEAEDKDGDTLKYIIVTKPQHGKLSGKAPNITYTPDNNFTGNDCFTFNVNDGNKDSNTSIVSILSVKDDNSYTGIKSDTISIEELSLYFKSNSLIYKQTLMGKNSVGNLNDIGVSYDIEKMLSASGYGKVYITITNNQQQNIVNTTLFLFLDASIEENNNTFFNEYGKYVNVPGLGSSDLDADYWQIDEPGYLHGNIVNNLNKGILDNTNHINKSNPNDVSMALGFDIESIPSNSSITYVLKILPTSDNGLMQIDKDSNISFYYNVLMDSPFILKCK